MKLQSIELYYELAFLLELNRLIPTKDMDVDVKLWQSITTALRFPIRDRIDYMSDSIGTSISTGKREP